MLSIRNTPFTAEKLRSELKRLWVNLAGGRRESAHFCLSTSVLLPRRGEVSKQGCVAEHKHCSRAVAEQSCGHRVPRSSCDDQQQLVLLWGLFRFCAPRLAVQNLGGLWLSKELSRLSKPTCTQFPEAYLSSQLNFNTFSWLQYKAEQYIKSFANSQKQSRKYMIQ